MKKIQYIALLLLVIFTAGCNKDQSGSVELDAEALFVYEYGASASTSFSHNNMVTFGAVDYPDGWTIDVSLATSKIVATAPADSSEGDDQGEVTLYGYDEEGSVTVLYMLVAKTQFVALDDPNNYMQSNCMILTKPNTLYTFNPNRRGEERVDQSRKAASCEMIWRSPNMPVGYPYLTDDGKMALYTISDIYDCDDDGDKNDIVEGNALFAAYDSSGNIIWSWHIWVTESDPTQNTVSIGGVEMLPRNLGAATNSIASTDELLTSYGLYYQWGRRDPFIYPCYYNVAGSVDTPLYDNDGVYTEHDLVDLTSTTGTIAYTNQNPMDFILGDDWKYQSEDTLWGSGESKSIYDPSPMGWRVPSTEQIVKIAAVGGEIAPYADGTYGYAVDFDGEYMLALGRKVYLDGSTQNVSGDDTFAEGGGYYWSRDAVSGTNQASAFCFYVDRNGSVDDRSDDSVAVNDNSYVRRGNGLQIRAVKDN